MLVWKAINWIDFYFDFEICCFYLLGFLLKYYARNCAGLIVVERRVRMVCCKMKKVVAKLKACCELDNEHWSSNDVRKHAVLLSAFHPFAVGKNEEEI